jgi:hypothetical protein
MAASAKVALSTTSTIANVISKQLPSAKLFSLSEKSDTAYFISILPLLLIDELGMLGKNHHATMML